MKRYNSQPDQKNLNNPFIGVHSLQGQNFQQPLHQIQSKIIVQEKIIYEKYDYLQKMGPQNNIQSGGNPTLQQKHNNVIKNLIIPTNLTDLIKKNSIQPHDLDKRKYRERQFAQRVLSISPPQCAEKIQKDKPIATFKYFKTSRPTKQNPHFHSQINITYNDNDTRIPQQLQILNCEVLKRLLQGPQGQITKPTSIDAEQFKYCKLRIKKICDNEERKSRIIVIDINLLKTTNELTLQLLVTLKVVFKIILVFDLYQQSWQNVQEIIKKLRITYDAIYAIKKLNQPTMNLQIYLVDFTKLLQISSELFLCIYIQQDQKQFFGKQKYKYHVIISDLLIRKIPIVFLEDAKSRVIYASELYKAILSIINIEYNFQTLCTPFKIELQLKELSLRINMKNQDEQYLREFKKQIQITYEQLQNFEANILDFKDLIIDRVKSISESKIFQLHYLVGDLFARNHDQFPVEKTKISFLKFKGYEETNLYQVKEYRIGIHTVLKSLGTMIADDLKLDVFRVDIQFQYGQNTYKLNESRTLKQCGIEQSGEIIYANIESIHTKTIHSLQINKNRPKTSEKYQNLSALDLVVFHPGLQTNYQPDGVTIEATCVNNKCINFQRELIYPLGFGTFNMNSVLHTIKCTVCPYRDKHINPPVNIGNFLFKDCKWTLSGTIKSSKGGGVIQHSLSQFNTVIGAKNSSLSNIIGKLPWASVFLEVKPISKKTKTNHLIQPYCLEDTYYSYL